MNLYYGQFPVAHINFEEYLATRLVGTELLYSEYFGEYFGNKIGMPPLWLNFENIFVNILAFGEIFGDKIGIKLVCRH